MRGAALRAALPLLLLAGVTLPATPAGADPRPAQRVIVQLRGPDGVEALADREAREGAVVLHRYRHVLDGFAAEVPLRRLAALREDPRVLRVVADQRIEGASVQSDPPWGLGRLDQRPPTPTTAYQYDTTGAGVTAYVLDTGVRLTHSDFGGRASSGYDFVDGDPDASPQCKGHGTQVAGNIAGSTYGVAKDAAIVALRVWDCDSTGWQSNVIAALDWVVANRSGPSLANFSGGGPAFAPTDEAVARTTAAGVTVVVGALNSGDDACRATPAREPSAITVGATDQVDARAYFSNFGACVDIFAPGVSVRSAGWESDTDSAYYTGTSASAAYVSGVVARLLEEYPDATPAEVAATLRSTATAGVVTDSRSPFPDLVYADPGVEEPPACTLTGTEGADSLTGTAGADVICGLGGDDVINGAAGGDLLVGGEGDDKLLGKGGDDVINGAAGNDRCTGGGGTDTAEECEVLVTIP